MKGNVGLRPQLLLHLGDVLLGVEASHAAGAGGGNGLSVSEVLDVTGGEDTWDGGEGGAWDGLDVAGLVHVDLALDDGGGWGVADGVEEAVDLEVVLLALLGVADGEGVEQLAVTLGLEWGGVEEDLDLWVLLDASLHDGGGSEVVLSDDEEDLGAVLGEELGLLAGRVTATDDS